MTPSNSSQRPPNEEAGSTEIRAIAVVGQILDALAEADGRLSAAEIARSLGMTPPRAWRHLNSLASLGLIEGGADRGFALGGRLAHLGHRAIEQFNLTSIAQPHLEALRTAAAESVYLAVPSDAGANVVISLDAPAPISIHLALGVTMGWHSSASGRVLLALGDEARRESVLASELTDSGQDPITDAVALRDRLDTIRSEFLETAETDRAMRRSSARLTLNAAAAPVFNHTGIAVGAIGILTGIPGRDAVTDASIITPLFETARRISADLGSTRWTNRPTSAS